MKLRIAKWIHSNFAGERHEHIVPGDWLTLEFGELDGNKSKPETMKPMYIAHTQNDGYEIWIAWNHPGGKWITHFRREEALKLAWFIIWEWRIKAEWLGLKRKIWYWSNAKLVESYRSR